MNQKGMIIPILASIGVGAATYYGMRRNGNMHPIATVTSALRNQMMKTN
ncbi:hypothetical protein J2T56_000016 [Natronobacillus azotifigens]|uniref:Uncharacterized protein n=1 Tax=Natronobacillus azotifigens TaxID=472978 RepID=A0A9J6R7Z6_9BACI|nr:hypothetical protein [Natronobacillus azotifigens]MCZ0701770.1 hypothetical protein [Natronobacillus azotifigens]